jgi:uncharacterized membrane protein
MKIKLDKYNLWFLAITVGTFLLGIALWQTQYIGFGAGLIFVSLIFFVMFLNVSLRPREHFIRDERSVRVNEKAGYHTFWVLIVVFSILNAPGSPFRALYVKDISTPLLLIGLYSWLILRGYYDKKGF